MHPAITPRVRAAKLLERDWDAIVVGSGVGGLVCAALLATRANRRVLVLERHYEPGGLSQTFRRRRFAWDVGVHYVGELAPGTMLRRLFDATTGRRLDWTRLPRLHDRLIAPGLDARLGGDREALRAQWLEHARGEQRAVDRVLGEIEACARAAPPHFLARMREGGDGTTDRSPFLAFSDRTTDEVLATCGASPRLRALATYTWGNYGSPPERSSFAALALTTAHYFGGAFHPVGGGGAIARELAQTIVAHGGAVIVRAEVDEILVRDGRARGVRLRSGDEVMAPVVVSDAGARTTLERLLRVPTELAARVGAIAPSDAHVGIYVGLRAAPRALGLDGTNLCIRSRPLEEDGCSDARAWALGEREDPPALFASTVCAIHPTSAAGPSGACGERTAITGAAVVPYDAFAAWRDTARGARGAEYEAHKARLGRSMLALLGEVVPLDTVEHVEISTPLTTAWFSGHPRGEVAGLDPSPARFRHGPRPHTPIAGLYLTGQDVWSCGIGGAACGGLLTACAITRRDLPRELATR